VELLLVTDPVLAFDDEVGLGEAVVQVAGPDLVMGEDVVAHEGIEDGGEGRGPNLDPAAGTAKGLAVRGGLEDERLGVVLDLAMYPNEDGLVVADQADDVVARDVVGGEDGNPRPVQRRTEVGALE